MASCCLCVLVQSNNIITREREREGYVCPVLFCCYEEKS